MQTLKDIVSVVAEETGKKKGEVELILKSAFSVIDRTANRGEEVRVHDFGTFSLQERSARKGRNPATGAEIEIPASSVVKFKPVKRSK